MIGMKIKVIIPNAGMELEKLQAREEMLSTVVRKDTIVSVVSIQKGPVSIESDYDAVLVGPEIVELCIEAEKDDFDAIVIYCLNDPAINACRQMVNIPVIGPGQVSMLLASSLGYKFSVLTALDEMIVQTSETVKHSGIDPSRLASIRSIGIPVVEVRKDRESTIGKLVSVGEECISNDRAQVILLGCLGFAGMAKDIEAKLNIPVIDPAFAAINFCELLYYQRLNFSKLAFPTPAKKEIIL